MASGMARSASSTPLRPEQFEGSSRMWNKQYVINTNAKIRINLMSEREKQRADLRKPGQERKVWGGSVPAQPITDDIRPGALTFVDPNAPMGTTKDLMDRRLPVIHELGGLYFDNLTPAQRERCARDHVFLRRQMIFAGLASAPYYYSPLHGKQNMGITTERSGVTFKVLENANPFFGGRYFRFVYPPWLREEVPAYKQKVYSKQLEIPAEKLPVLLEEWSPFGAFDYLRSTIDHYAMNHFFTKPLTQLDRYLANPNNLESILTEDEFIGLHSRRFALTKLAEGIAQAAKLGLVTINKPTQTTIAAFEAGLALAAGDASAPFSDLKTKTVVPATWTLSEDQQKTVDGDIKWIYEILGLGKNPGNATVQVLLYYTFYQYFLTNAAFASNFDVSAESFIKILQQNATPSFFGILFQSIAENIRDVKGIMLNTALPATAIMANFFA